MSAAELAQNRWPGLLAHFGIDRDFLTGKHAPCPACGGKDRFRFDDRDGRGTFFCSHCGAGDGFKLLRMIKGWSFREAAKEIESVVGNIPPTVSARNPSDPEKLEYCQRIWRQSSPVTLADPVGLYLSRRCRIESIPSVIRFHPRLAYRHDDGSITRHPAMIAKVQDADDHSVAIHRTYLTSDGHKADVSPAKKTVGTRPPSSAVRLFQPSGTIGIAEGIETALSAFVLFGVPTWAAVTASGMEKWAPPSGTKRVVVFGDNDASGTGQAAAWALKKRLIASGVDAKVRIPSRAKDWNDVLEAKR